MTWSRLSGLLPTLLLTACSSSQTVQPGSFDDVPSPVDSCHACATWMWGERSYDYRFYLEGPDSVDHRLLAAFRLSFYDSDGLKRYLPERFCVVLERAHFGDSAVVQVLTYTSDGEKEGRMIEDGREQSPYWLVVADRSIAQFRRFLSENLEESLWAGEYFAEADAQTTRIFPKRVCVELEYWSEEGIYRFFGEEYGGLPQRQCR